MLMGSVAWDSVEEHCCGTCLLSVRRSDGLSSVNREATGTANSLRKRVAFGDRTIPIHVSRRIYIRTLRP